MKPQFYPIEDRLLYAGEYPGHWDPTIAKARLEHLLATGIRTFIDLTTPLDHLEPYGGLLEELGAEQGLSLMRISVPVPDMGVPDNPETTRRALAAVGQAIATSPAVYLHCWGGIGRTGTLVGCWFRQCGLAPAAALARVQKLYATHMPKVSLHPESPQTAAQKRYVRAWNG
jgi:protein-tyrosine phosphatase